MCPFHLALWNWRQDNPNDRNYDNRFLKEICNLTATTTIVTENSIDVCENDNLASRLSLRFIDLMIKRIPFVLECNNREHDHILKSLM